MICCQGIAVPSFVMACELFAAKYRTFYGIMIGIFWAVATCLYALLAYLVQNWVHLQLIISLFGLLSIPLYWYYKCTSLTRANMFYQTQSARRPPLDNAL